MSESDAGALNAAIRREPFYGRDTRLSALQKMTDKELTDAVAEFCEDAAGFYSVPRDCVCGEQHLSRQTYWNHRVEDALIEEMRRG